MSQINTVHNGQNGTSIAIFNEAIAFFLAGAFAVKTAITINGSDGSFEITNMPLFGIGIYLVLSGCIVVLNVWKISFITRLLNRMPKLVISIILKVAPLILFIITTAVYAITLVEFAPIPTIYYAGFGILLFVAITLVYSVFRERQRIQNVAALSLAFVFELAAMYLVLSKYQDISLVLIFLAFSALIILLTGIRMSRNG